MLTSTCCKTVRKESTISVTFKTHRKKSVGGGMATGRKYVSM